MLTLEEGILMAITLNGICIFIFFLAYFIAMRNYNAKVRQEEEDKKPKPWEG